MLIIYKIVECGEVMAADSVSFLKRSGLAVSKLSRATTTNKKKLRKKG